MKEKKNLFEIVFFFIFYRSLLSFSINSLLTSSLCATSLSFAHLFEPYRIYFNYYMDGHARTYTNFFSIYAPHYSMRYLLCDTTNYWLLLPWLYGPIWSEEWMENKTKQQQQKYEWKSAEIVVTLKTEQFINETAKCFSMFIAKI